MIDNLLPPDVIRWTKNGPHLHNFFEDGSKFLVALVVRNEAKGTEHWDMDVVVTDCDGEGMRLKTVEGEYYSAWDWTDFDFFFVIEGREPWNESKA